MIGEGKRWRRDELEVQREGGEKAHNFLRDRAGRERNKAAGANISDAQS